MEVRIDKINITSTLRFKMAFMYLSIAILVFVASNYYTVIVVRDYIVNSTKGEMLSSAGVIAEITASKKNSDGSVDEKFSFINDKDYDRIVLTDKNASVIYDSLGGGNLIGKTILVKEVFTAIDGKEDFLYDIQKDKIQFYCTVPIILNDQVNGVVYIYKISSQEAKLLSSIQGVIFIFSILLCIISSVIVLFLSGVLTRQIRLINQGIANMNMGNYQEKIPVKSSDEMGRLAITFNDFAQRLEITEQRRRRFVSDAAHELKTPLASIKLLVDSLISTENIDKEILHEFLGDISSEIERLVRITEDLFTITKSDEKIMQKKESIDTFRVVNDAIRIIEPAAEGKNIKMIDELSQGLFIYGSKDNFYQIVYNLLDNAVKYNKDNGQVKVILKDEKENIILSVADTGVGIPQEEVGNIFLRFYRVDRARSRETGGTGLGLAIVKGHVDSFGGKITVESHVNEGTVFTVFIPKTDQN